MKNKGLIFAVVTAVLLSSATFIWALANNVYDTGVGSQSDPLVSVSYINQQLLPRISNYIEQRLAGEDAQLGSDSASGNNRHFEVVSVAAGRRLIGESGTEFILRDGRGTIIASNLGGVSDTTNGVDLAQDAAIPLNHLLIVPRSDGRGLNITADALVMVRGRYSIQ